MKNEKLISKEQVKADIFNKFFIIPVPNLKIPTNQNYDTDFIVINDQVTSALNRSSCDEVFRKKGLFRSFAKFTGKHLCQRIWFGILSKTCKTRCEIFRKQVLQL